MKRFWFAMAFGTGIAALVGLAIIVRTGESQTVTGVDGSVILVEGSAVGQRLGQAVATQGTSIVTLNPPRSVLPQLSPNEAAASSSVPRTGDGAETTQRYFVTDLGTLGGSHSVAYAVNDAGQIVGQSSLAGDASTHSFLYSNGKRTDLYPLNSQSLQTAGPTGINDVGQIASGVIVGGVYVPAVFNSRTGDLTLLGTLGGVTSYGFNGVATAINNVGNVVGYSYIDSINRHAFWYRNNVITDIGSFGGYSAALAVNDGGVIVGFASDRFNGVAHAFIYTNGVMTNIHPATESYARGVNNQGQVVGDFLTADHPAFHAFLYSQGTFTDLGFEGSAETTAFAINDLGQIVGITSITNKQHAFIYENGQMIDLNGLIPRDFGWELIWAFDVNNHGQIAGSGLVNGKFRAFLLTPAISSDQCKGGGWENFGFRNQGQCIKFVNTGK